MKLVSRFYPHKLRMRITDLHDEEYYQITIKKRGGDYGLAIVPGHLLKDRDFWKKKLAVYPMLRKLHWARRNHSPTPPAPRRQPEYVEVGLPWINPQGRVMVAFVKPWSNTRSSWRAQRDPDYAESVRKYIKTTF